MRSWRVAVALVVVVVAAVAVGFRDKQLRQLKGPILAVFLCIALHINEKGIAWPSIKLIAEKTGYNKDTVCKCIASLELMGFLSRCQKNANSRGKFGSNVYRLFPKSRRFKAKKPVRFEPCRVSPDTVASDTKKNHRKRITK